MPRKATDKLIEWIEEGIISNESVVLAALKYMSEDDVRDMIRINEFDFEGFLDEEE